MTWYDLFSVPLESIDVNVNIQGFVASVTSDLTYINKEDKAVGAVFIFPLDEQSAVYHFQAEIDGKVITAECQDKEQVCSLDTDFLNIDRVPFQ